MSELCSAVALGQLEHLEELVDMRVKCGKIFEEAAKGSSIITSQKCPDDCVNSYWAYVAKLTDNSIDWHVFRDKYLELGGDGIYAAWKLAYQEPVFKNNELVSRDKYLTENFTCEDGICPAAEALQPRLLQFKTNYFDTDIAERKADVLYKTIKYFE